MHQSISSVRKWTPYEQTQLARHGLDQLEVPEIDQRPVEYLTGRVEFLGWKFQVSPAVLIPRVETEELVDLVVREVEKLQPSQLSTPLRIVDVGTGSGAIGLSLWRLLSQSQLLAPMPEIWLTDISSQALAVAQANWLEIKADALSDSAPHFLKSDLLTDWPAHQPISILVANLPYIPSATVTTLDKSVLEYEPVLALDGGLDGLRLIDQLLFQAKTQLAPSGVIWLEVAETHTITQLEKLRPEYTYEFFSDSFGKSRFVRAILKLQ